jgi:hypothetical protein
MIRQFRTLLGGQYIRINSVTAQLDFATLAGLLKTRMNDDGQIDGVIRHYEQMDPTSFRQANRTKFREGTSCPHQVILQRNK